MRKTTLLRMIAGLEHADSGRIMLDGDDATNMDVRKRHVGFVFQHYALFRHLTVFENIAFGLRVRPRSERPDEKEIRAKVGQLLELAQLRHHAGHSQDRQPVVAFVRPSETEIVPDVASDDGISASVHRILGAGAVARVELVANGDARKGRKDFFEVEIPGAEVASLGLATGQCVKIRSRRLSIFPEQNGISTS